MRRSPRHHRVIALVAVVVWAAGCSSETSLDKLQRQLDQYPEYSVTLQDMEEKGYRHQYRVAIGELEPGSDEMVFRESIRDWQKVGRQTYNRYQPYLGMVILSKGADGKVDQGQHPPGYQQVGDDRYGQWRDDRRGGSFWEFYGKYALMSHLFGTFGRPVYRNDWGSYRTARQSGRPYFGSQRQYGTRGSYTKTTNPTFYDRQRVRQQRSGDRFSRKVSDRTRRSSMSGTRSRSSGRGGK